MALRIAFLNDKGGVGKQPVHFCLRRHSWTGRSVSIDDRDAQRNATSAAIHLGIQQGASASDIIVMDIAGGKLNWKERYQQDPRLKKTFELEVLPALDSQCAGPAPGDSATAAL